ncbi:probable small intestine urate exporter [Sciurus carolinensis]|uniref:probable small intestine urate exporter n=1 Tax=Sciurus carolinensis TaxID=30640 RepID=UPI001FB2DE53|nr:probable small intestine urate exporter [Sciurus carolinensis]XP_047415334.1 probable small intestine urate exporter [Sciurus carolinensis]XP_047415335.1 probable small intestine urate exporter [Sciurus carolinensis]XP_047415336.1 probable small intestine urate exporter [Sciurus carolinensis]XP_047415337.1 probable small intestine urate exporter [Sciurus carolinensis]
MSTGATAKAAAGDVSSDGGLNTAPEQAPRKGLCSVRHGLALVLQLCNFSIYTQQMNLSIAITAMVNSTVAPSQSNVSTEMPLTDPQDHWNLSRKEFKAVAPAYDWSPEIQGIILSSLNYGSFVAPIPTGYMAGVWGAKYVVGIGLLASSVLTLFIPLAADAGVALLIVLRVIQGIAQVMVLTGQYSIWVKWAPPLERSQLTTIAGSGSMLGTFIVLLTGGLICQNIGWPYVFYIFGGIGCACCLLWFPLVYNDPGKHPFIGADEKRYIMSSLAQQDCLPGWSLPLKAMVLSLPLWAVVVAYFCEYWLFYTVMAYTPTYISSVLQANLRDSGILSALPFVVGCFCIILSGLLADFLLSRRVLRLVTIRKLFTAIGVFFSSGVLVALHWVRSSHSTTMVFLVLSSAFSSLCEAGALVNFLDIAPRYAGFLKGLLQVFAHISGAVSPTVAGILISQDLEVGWRNVFLLAAAVNISGLLFYLIFSRAEVQDWAKEQTFTHL